MSERIPRGGDGGRSGSSRSSNEHAFAALSGTSVTPLWLAGPEASQSIVHRRWPSYSDVVSALHASPLSIASRYSSTSPTRVIAVSSARSSVLSSSQYVSSSLSIS